MTSIMYEYGNLILVDAKDYLSFSLIANPFRRGKCYPSRCLKHVVILLLRLKHALYL